MAKADLTAQRLRELLHYDPETGVFVWRVQRGAGAKRGDVAGTANPDGYSTITVCGHSYLAHRLAILHATGGWPVYSVDHIDGNPANNRLSNLRDVTHQVNIQNQRRPHSQNSTGLLGVSFSQRTLKFVASIGVDGVTRRLGSFKSAQEAHLAYLAAKKILHPES